jgi:uncharacterized protein (DUF849 family)
MPDRPALIKACLNGSRQPGSHPALPLTPEQLAEAARRAVDAGAGAVHIHQRAPDGTQTLDAKHIADAVTAIRNACPGLPVGVTTGAWIERDPAKRLNLIRAWTVLPDFASVNFSEEGAEELAALLLDMGVGPEAGIWTVENAEAYVRTADASRYLRILVETRDRDGSTAIEQARAINAVLDAAGITVPRLQHGMGQETWGVLEDAFDAGYDVRIGLEDVLTLPDGAAAIDNADLVTAAVQLARRRGREPAGF